MTFLKKFPLPIAGLILGLAALGNLMASYGQPLRWTLGIIAGILYIAYLAKLLFLSPQVQEELKLPPIASVFPTFSMATMLLAGYIRPFAGVMASVLWYFGILIHLVLIIWFTLQFVSKKNIPMVLPSWYIVYVGIVVASVTAPAFQMIALGRLFFWFGLICYLILIPVVIYRVIVVKGIPEPLMPTYTILAAPGGLLLAGFTASFLNVEGFVMTGFYDFLQWFLGMLCVFFYFVVLKQLPKLLKSKFYPSFSAFTFPLVICAMGLKMTTAYTLKTTSVALWVLYVVQFMEAVAFGVTIYVLVLYLRFLFAPSKPAQS